MEPIIRVENLTFEYRKVSPEGTATSFRAVDGVNFEVQPGEFAAVLGMNGSGKSTLAKHLNGLLLPTEGEVWIEGMNTREDEHIWDIRSTVGMVFQNPDNQIVSSVVEDDVAFGPKQVGITGEELERVVADSIRLTGLDYEEVKERSPFELSGGQKRRVAIAGVLAMKPEILILDEPTAGLDPSAHRDVLDLIRRIHRQEDMTILLVSHNMGDIAELADRVLVMNRGRLVMNGTPAEVFARGKQLREMGLGQPPATEFMERLKERLPGIDAAPLSIEDAAKEICRYLESGKR